MSDTRTRLYRVRRLVLASAVTCVVDTVCTGISPVLGWLAAVPLVVGGAVFVAWPVRLPATDQTFGELYRAAAATTPGPTEQQRDEDLELFLGWLDNQPTENTPQD